MEKTDKSVSALQIVCFKVGKEEYGIDILKVQEILKLPKITRLPKSAEFIMGVMDLRGKVIPIIDLSKRFRIENGSSGVVKRAIVVDIRNKSGGTRILIRSATVVKVDGKDTSRPRRSLKASRVGIIVGIANSPRVSLIVLDIGADTHPRKSLQPYRPYFSVFVQRALIM